MELSQYQLYTASRRVNGDQDYPATIEPFDDKDFSQKNWPDDYANIDPFEFYRFVFNGELNAYANPELIYTRGKTRMMELRIWFYINCLAMQKDGIATEQHKNWSMERIVLVKIRK